MATPVEGKPLDDDPDGFRDLRHAFTVFAESDKKTDATKRSPMSITIQVEGSRYCDADGNPDDSVGMNLANANARDLLDWIGYGDVDLWTGSGLLLARDVAVQCRQSLRLCAGNVDRARPSASSGGPGTGRCRIVVAGRREGYLMDRVEQLLVLAEKAGDGFLTYG